MRVWDNGIDHKELKVIPFSIAKSKMLCCAFSSCRAATGHNDGDITVSDLESGVNLYHYQHRGSRITAIAISRDGNLALAALSDRGVYLYRLPSAN